MEKGVPVLPSKLSDVALKLGVPFEALVLGEVPVTAPTSSERPLTVRIVVSGNFDEFDQTFGLLRILHVFQKLLNEADIDVGEVKPSNSITITVSMPESALPKLLAYLPDLPGAVTRFVEQQPYFGAEELLAACIQNEGLAAQFGVQLARLQQAAGELSECREFAEMLMAITLPDDEAVPKDLRGRTLTVR